MGVGMEKQYDVLSRISGRYDRMSKGHKAIAAFISDHYDQAVFMTAAKLEIGRASCRERV